jgi:transcriptional regulator with XRE-family HTH domain
MALTVRRIRLGAQLRELRTAAKETREQLADVLGCSPSKITYLETGRTVISKLELKEWAEHYNATDRLACLEEIRKEASKRGWWSTYRLPEWLAAYVGLENDANTLCTLATGLIPGMLQTEGYARELHQLSPHMTPPGDVERRVKARMRRQTRLTNGDQFTCTAIIDEAALHRCAGHVSVAAEQFNKLLTMARLPNVTVHVLPFGVGLHSSAGGSFSLLEFPEGLLPAVAYQEYAVGGHIIDDQTVVDSLSTIYRELRDQALDATESLAFIAEFVDHTR